jgi:hypothetical protein
MCDHLGAKGSTLGEKIESLRAAGKLPEEVGGLAGAAHKTDEEEIADARERAYDLMRIAYYLGPRARDFWPGT